MQRNELEIRKSRSLRKSSLVIGLVAVRTENSRVREGRAMRLHHAAERPLRECACAFEIEVAQTEGRIVGSGFENRGACKATFVYGSEDLSDSHRIADVTGPVQLI